MEDILKRLEQATLKLEALATPLTAAQPASSPASSASLAAFDSLKADFLSTFLQSSKSIGGILNDQALLVEAAFNAQKSLIQTATLSKKPDQQSLMALIKPLQEAISLVIKIKDSNRPSPLFTHLSAVAEGIGALGWVVVEPTPAPYVNEMKESSQFWANKVIKEFKDKDQKHLDWANSYSTLLTELFSYVKKWHTTGLVWNQKGGDAFNVQVKPVTATPTPTTSSSPPKPAGGLFGDITGNVTAGLRKVDKSEMTHKNPELRATGVVKASEIPAPATKTFSSNASKAPPKLALEGNKWAVENQVNNNAVILDKTELRHVVYIYNCSNSTIQIKGKVNAVTLDNCKKVGLVLDSVVSTVDVVNCKSCQVQITGKAPTANIDKTDGLQLYLSKESMGIEILSAKSSEMNVAFDDPKKAPGTGDMVERAIAEQFKTLIVDGELRTTTVEHSG